MSDPRRILLVQTQRLGDVVCALPAWEALALAHPEAEVDAMVHHPWQELLSEAPYISQILTYNRQGDQRGLLGRLALTRSLRQRRYDWIITIHAAASAAMAIALSSAPRRSVLWRYGRTKRPHWVFGYTEQEVQDRLSGERHEVEHNLDYLRALGVPAPDLRPQIRLLDDERTAARELLARHGWRPGPPLVVLHPGHGGGRQAWPPEHFLQVSCDLRADGCQVAITGSQAEAATAAEIARASGAMLLAGLTGLRELCGVLAEASLFVSVSTGPMHLASALELPAVTIYGPKDLRRELTRFGPYRSPAAAVESPLDCPCPGSRFCQRPLCLEAVTPESVMAAARRLMAA